MLNVDIHIGNVVPLTPPGDLKKALPTDRLLDEQVRRHRKTIERILDGKDRRMIAIVGPCSIHDPKAALDYARRLAKFAKQAEGYLFVVMRAYFAKPRTIKGWKGLFYDPGHTLNGGDMIRGARIMREIALEIAKLGLPIATEVLDEDMIQYIDDLSSWACIGARTVESQPHRELASGLSTAVAMKNSTVGGFKTAIDAMEAASYPQTFRGTMPDGRRAAFPSTGNPFTHLVLRGSNGQPNFDRETIACAIAEIEARNRKDELLKNGIVLHTSIIVDAAHENSGKKALGQPAVIKDVIAQRVEGNEHVVGFMVESNIKGGNLKVPAGAKLSELDYGVSITDECLGWEDTESMLFAAARSLREMFARTNRKSA